MNNKVLRKALSVIVAAVMLLALLPNGFVSDAASYGKAMELARKYRLNCVQAGEMIKGGHWLG